MAKRGFGVMALDDGLGVLDGEGMKCNSTASGGIYISQHAEEAKLCASPDCPFWE